MTEETIGTLHEVSSHSYDMLYDLQFTSERMIAILIQSPSDIQPSMSPWAFLIGDSFSKRKEQQERRKIAQERHDRYKNLTLDELVAASPDNFAIPYNTIESVEIKKKLLDYHLIFQISGITARKLKTDFLLKKNQVSEATLLLERVLSAKIKKE